MTDGEFLRQWILRGERWLSLLQDLRRFHAQELGRLPQAVAWVTGDTLGAFSWYGFFWEPERYWFGFGYRAGEWRPVIEADSRLPQIRYWMDLQNQIPGAWDVEVVGIWARLWAPVDMVPDTPTQLDWFRERSRELHEFAVAES